MNKMFMGLAVITVILVSGFFYFNSHNSKGAVTTAELAHASLPVASPSKMVDKIREFPGLDEPQISQQESQSECKEALEDIETLPLTALIYDLTNKKLDLNSKCLFLSKTKPEILNGFPEVCEISQNGELTKECIEKLFLYKNIRVQQATEGKDLDSLSTELIISKLVGLMAGGDFLTPEGIQKLRQVGTEIYERMPNSESAGKAAMIGYFVDGNLTDIDKAEYEKVMDEVRTKFPENWEIYEMNLVYQKTKNEKKFRQEVLNYYSNYPNSGIANYYMGCLDWMDSKVQTAQTFFKTAVRLSPNQKRFVTTLEKSQTVQPPTSICSVEIGFAPDQF